MYFLEEELARAHRAEQLDNARQAHRGQQLAQARRKSRRAERAALQARLVRSL
jgi:hypothetical protein